MSYEPFVLAVKPQAGQVLSLEIKKRREDSRTTTPSNSHAVATVRVMEAADGSARLEWVAGEPALDTAPEETDIYVELAHKVLADLAFEISLDEEEGFGGLTNVSQIERSLAAIVNEKALEFAAEFEDETDRANFVSAAPRVLSAPRIIRTASRDMEMYFSLSGAELDPEEPIIADLQVPDPLGGLRLVSSEVELELAGIDEETKTARVRYTQRFSDDVILEFQDAVRAAFGEHLPEDAELPEIDLHDEAEYVYDLETGWMKEVAHRRVMSAGDKLRRVEITDIRLASLTNS